METVLSIDVGIKNLSFCTLGVDASTISILDWKNVVVTDECIKKIALQQLTEKIIMTLEEHFDDNSYFNYVVIENQPMLKNGLMKTVAVVIFTYFNMLKIHHGNIKDVRFVSAINKLRNTGLLSTTYKDRKKSSIELAKIHIAKYCPQYSKWFLEQNKKDDCADSLNQGIAFIKKTWKNIE
jgi:hypothetical protein